MGLLDALADEDFRREVGRGLVDAGNRGIVAGLLGAPVDASAAAINLPLMAAGYLGSKAGLLDADRLPQPITRPAGGSEWIGQRLQDAGLVSGERNPLAEGLAALVGPAGMTKAARALPVIEAEGLLGVLTRPSAGAREAMRGGPISAEGKARLLQDLQAGEGSGRYSLGTVTEGQGKGLDKLFGNETAGREVLMTDDAFRHILERRLQDQGHAPEQIADFVERAMAARSRPDLNVAKGAQNPSLLNTGVRDGATGRTYDARLPLRQVDDGYEVRSVVPEGLRNNKAPKR